MSSSLMASKEELEIEMKDCDQHAGWFSQQLQMKAGFGGQMGKEGISPPFIWAQSPLEWT